MRGRGTPVRSAYAVKCTGLTKDPATGEVTEVRCTYDPETRGGEVKGRKIKSTIHWVSAAHAVDAEVRLYDRLFLQEDPDDAPPGRDWLANLNPGSLEVLAGCKVEAALAGAAPGSRWQFERLGYFCADKGTRPERPVFNRTVPLRDTWAKIQKRNR